jgi:type II secretory ATPase GspE/PulE/Tfp pilus assembly ATPase PilB-like protein
MERDAVKQAPRVTLLDGSNEPGELAFFSFEQRFVGLAMQGSSVKRVPFSSIAFFRFSAEQGLAEGVMPIAWRAGAPLSRDPNAFKGKLSNQKVFSGKMRAYLRNATGAFLVIPSNQRYGADSYIFIPEENIAELTVNESLGSMLVKSGTLNEAQVSAGLEQQKTLRMKLLGGYLGSVKSLTAEQLAEALDRQRDNPKVCRIGEVLVGERVISEAELTAALEAQAQDRKKPLGQILVEQGLLTNEELNRVMAHKLGIPEVSIKRFPVDPKAIRAIPKNLARAKRVVPLCYNAGALAVAMENPLDHALVQELTVVGQCKIDAVLATPAEIAEGLEIYYGDIHASVGELQNELTDAGAAAAAHADAKTADVVTEADGALVRVVNKILLEAYRQKASDIHIEPRKDGTCNVRFRKDGELEHFMNVPAGFRNALVSRMKIMAQLDISEKRKPQDGRIDFSKFSALNFSLRVATIPTNDGAESITLRILTQAEPVELAKLGLEPDSLTGVLAMAKKAHGLVLVSGPTGSGKTTTLHSMLAHLNTAQRKIWTAEDPIEITQEGLNQVQINSKIDWTFAAALRSFLRADPDIIMVGEMRDAETASIAVSAALTGHLVLSTVHTNSACETVTRLIDMGLDPFSFADSLKGIIAQRLVRALDTCKTAYHPSAGEIDLLAEEYLGGGSAAEISVLVASWRALYAGNGRRFTLYKEAGCEHCSHKGFKGRAGIHEVLTVTPEVHRLIQTRAPLAAVVAEARQGGLRTLKQDGILKVLQGKTTIGQVRAACS